MSCYPLSSIHCGKRLDNVPYELIEQRHHDDYAARFKGRQPMSGDGTRSGTHKLTTSPAVSNLYNTPILDILSSRWHTMADINPPAVQTNLLTYLLGVPNMGTLPSNDEPALGTLSSNDEPALGTLPSNDEPAWFDASAPLLISAKIPS